jgi:hypothetical protein
MLQKKLTSSGSSSTLGTLAPSKSGSEVILGGLGNEGLGILEDLGVLLNFLKILNLLEI